MTVAVTCKGTVEDRVVYPPLPGLVGNVTPKPLCSEVPDDECAGRACSACPADPYAEGLAYLRAPPKPPDEVRVTDPATGGQKGSKLARYDLIPVGPLHDLAVHFGKGAQKYDPRNWERGYAWSLSYAALQRHVSAFWDGEDFDAQTHSHHLTAAAWHCLALLEFTQTYKEGDDRPLPRATQVYGYPKPVLLH